MKVLLSTLLLASTLSVASCSVEGTEIFKNIIHTAIAEEMYRFIDALTFDELIGILELAKEKPIQPYSALDIKLQLFLLRVEKLPWWDELDDNDTDDFEGSYLLYQLHSIAYERARELNEKERLKGAIELLLAAELTRYLPDPDPDPNGEQPQSHNDFCLGLGLCLCRTL